MNVVTMARLNRAASDVQDELIRHGFWDDATAGPDVYLVPFGAAFGWQYYGRDSSICIPAVGLARLSRVFGCEHTSLRDVLRHEYGHVVADVHRGLMRSRQFRAAFGDGHHWNQGYEYDPAVFVSEYATKAPAEDFAETFMFYLKHRGVLPGWFRREAIRRKWQFVKAVSGCISLGRRKFS